MLAGLGGGTYLEVVGPDLDQPTPDRPRPFGIDTLTSDALVTWAARPDGPLDEVVAELERTGYDAGPISAMSRQRPDGTVLAWELTQGRLGEPWFGTVPFLIDWQESRHPTEDLPQGRQLARLVLSYPHPQGLRRIINVLGTNARIHVVTGEPSISVELE